MAVSELVKATLFGYPRNANFACLDFRGPLNDFMTIQCNASAECICRTQQGVWQRLNGGTRFASR